MKRANGLRMLVVAAAMTIGIQGVACAGEERSVEAGPPGEEQSVDAAPPSEATEEGKQRAAPAGPKSGSESEEAQAGMEGEAPE